MSSSKNSKQQLIDRLILAYGEDFKTPLSRDLGVNVSTIRRIFNQREEIPLVYVLAIDMVLSRSTD